MHPPGLDYLVAFFGTMMAGLVPVPVYPPDVTALGGSLARLFALIDVETALRPLVENTTTLIVTHETHTMLNITRVMTMESGVLKEVTS